MRKRVAPAFTNVGIYSESLVTGVVPRRCSPAVAQDRVITGNVANARARVFVHMIRLRTIRARKSASICNTHVGYIRLAKLHSKKRADLCT